MTSIPPPSLPPPDRAEDRPMTFIEATLWTIGSVVLFVSLWRIVAHLAPAWKDDHGVQSLCQIVAYGVLLVLLRTFYFSHARASLILAARPGSWLFYPIALLLGAAILFPSTAIYEAALQRWPDQAAGERLLAGFHELPRWRQATTGIGIVVTTPLVEEALFRGALFGTLRRHHHPALVVASTASLFALVHLQPQSFLPIAIVGAALAYLRTASGSLWPCVLMHMAYNGLSFFAQVTSSGETDEPLPRWPVVAGTVVSAGLLALAQHLRSRKGDPEPDLQQKEREEES